MQFSTKHMKAVTATAYGAPEVLSLAQVPIPTPSDQEILVRVHAASVSAADGMLRQGTPKYGRLVTGLGKPKQQIPGTGFSGEVVAVGTQVKQFKVGDHVLGETGLSFGAHAEYVLISEDGVVVQKPAHLSFEAASTICDGAVTAMNFLQHLIELKPGQRILINGASGSMGTAAVQLAKIWGAEVTGVCSGRNAELVKSLGADHVIDYTQTDFTEQENTYDVIFDTVGKSSFSAAKRALTAHGVYLSPVLSLPLLAQMTWTSYFGAQKALFSATGMRPAPEVRALLIDLMELMAAHDFQIVIDRRYPLDEIVEAHRYVDPGHKRGNVILHVA
ncbi:NAD(P)-dependent alcohol dehydrogenase [Pontibacter sp. G13]|uniref:NAD(P)-dependent alcohol dehydrogenase n=1 Tax=Pontibacter sp. G13 TaxID=3074898 RepID=UPI00288BD279|nr:NAD(P)-dependent alcohol dehydrogenase [Pontibacter sp. G13]WNJ20313.1 NAD(P)-dependent alcohol dehydrogenase [Pontibacter sp. G13]